MERINYSPSFTQYIVKNNILKNDPLCLVDVGASGGIASYWNIFGEFLKGFAFEPLCNECDRLNGEKGKPKDVTYFPYFIVSDCEESTETKQDQYATEVWKRASSIRAVEIQKMNYAQEYYNQGETPVYTDKNISLDRFFTKSPVETIDFIKIDTDGFDYNVLRGSENVLNNNHVLGVLIESQFHGSTNPHSNTFRNIDRFLTERGFHLFDLEPYRYTKSALPGQFVYSIPAQTTSGQVMWADALYFRDYVSDLKIENNHLNPIKLIKLACLYELFKLPDCSADLLNKYRSLLSSLVDIDHCLDQLVKNAGKTLTYSEYMKSFETNTKAFYPSPSISEKLYPIFGRRVLSKLKRTAKAIMGMR